MDMQTEKAHTAFVVETMGAIIAAEMSAMASEAWSPRYGADQSDGELSYRRARIVGLRRMREQFENLMFGLERIDGSINVYCAPGSVGDRSLDRLRGDSQIVARIVKIEEGVTAAHERIDNVANNIMVMKQAIKSAECLAEATVERLNGHENGVSNNLQELCERVSAVESRLIHNDVRIATVTQSLSSEVQTRLADDTQLSARLGDLDNARLAFVAELHDVQARLAALYAFVGNYADTMDPENQTQDTGLCADIVSCASKTDRLADRVSALEAGPV